MSSSLLNVDVNDLVSTAIDSYGIHHYPTTLTFQIGVRVEEHASGESYDVEFNGYVHPSFAVNTLEPVDSEDGYVSQLGMIMFLKSNRESIIKGVSDDLKDKIPHGCLDYPSMCNEVMNIIKESLPKQIEKIRHHYGLSPQKFIDILHKNIVNEAYPVKSLEEAASCFMYISETAKLDSSAMEGKVCGYSETIPIDTLTARVRYGWSNA